jgi:hypothetical protein
VVFFDEGTRSGKSIAAREQFPLLLDWLKAGLIQGILVPDIKRMTRDQSMQDGFEIATVLQDHRGKLVTGRPRRVWNLLDPDDYSDYRREVFEAGEEWLDIRTMFYGGMQDRTRQVLRGEWPPFFRSKPGPGYLSAVCYERQGGGWTTDAAQGIRPLSSRGHTALTWAKDPTATHTFECLREALTEYPTIGEVGRALYAAGIPSPWQMRGFEVGMWPSKVLYQILKNPTYGGRWQWIQHPGSSTVWRHYDPSETLEVPDLRYWSWTEHEYFRAKFLDGYIPRRRSDHAHPYAGLVACPGCNERMVAAGVYTSGFRDGLRGRIACPNRDVASRCSVRAWHSEEGVKRALEAEFLNKLAELPSRREQLRAELRQVDEDPLDARLAHIKRRQANIIALAMDLDDVTPELQAQQHELAEARRQVEAQLMRRRGSTERGQRETELASVEALLDGEPQAAYAKMTDAVRATLWRLLLKNRPVIIERLEHGNQYRQPRYRVVGEANVLGAQESDIWMSLHKALSSLAVA